MGFLDHYKNSTRPKIENAITRYSNDIKREMSASALKHSYTGTWDRSITVYKESKNITIIAPSKSILKTNPSAAITKNGGDYTRYIIDRKVGKVNGRLIKPAGMDKSPLEIARSLGGLKDYI